MLKKIFTYLQYGSHFCGIEHTSKNGVDTIHATVLKQSKTELNIESTFQSANIEDVVNKLPKNQHAILIINNDKVLSKTIESENNEPLKLVYKGFPNINLEEFYFEVLSEKSKHFISLCRKDYIQSILEDYSKKKVSVIDISLGNNLVSILKSYVKTISISTSNSTINLEDNRITQIEKVEVKPEDYEINGLRVSNEQLLSFAGALQSVIKNTSTETNFVARKESLTNDFKQTRFFNQFLKFAGIFILGMLLINFFIFNNYFNQVNELKQVSEVNQSTKQRIITLKESVSKKQKMVDDLLKSNGSKSSFYSNSIMQSLPNSVLLSDLNYQPLQKRVKADKDIELEKNSITLSGASNDSAVFSNWISQLDQKEWVIKVDIIDYGSSTNTNSDFKIKIVLNDD